MNRSKTSKLTLEKARYIVARWGSKSGLTPTERLRQLGCGTNRYERNLSLLADAEEIVEMDEAIRA